MKAVFIRRYGKPDVVEIGEFPEPTPAPDDLLVDVHAASVNPVDGKIRGGQLKPLVRLRFPVALGSDFAGVVRAVGPAVTRFKPGDRVYARVDKTRNGAFAEAAVVKEAHAAIAPASLSFEEAASLPLVALTAWQALVDFAALARGQRVLIHAGAGGLGTVAIQIAKHLGAHVTTTASARNRDLVRSLGADEVIDYRTHDFEEIASDIDVVLDSIGGETQKKSFRVMRPGGILVAVTGLPDAAFAREQGMAWPLVVGLGLLGWRRARLVKRLGVRYRMLFMWPSGEQLSRISALVAEGALKPVIDRTFSLAEAKEALAYVDAGHARGKVVIRVR